MNFLTSVASTTHKFVTYVEFDQLQIQHHIGYQVLPLSDSGDLLACWCVEKI